MKVDRRRIRYVMLSWTDQRYHEANFPETDVTTILEGLLERGVAKVYVEDKEFTLASLDDVHAADEHAKACLAQRKRR